jgi:hypothetical protein
LIYGYSRYRSYIILLYQAIRYSIFGNMPTLREVLLGIKQQEMLTEQQQMQRALDEKAASDREYARRKALEKPWEEAIRTYLVPELETVKEILGGGKGQIVTRADTDGGFASVYYNRKGHLDGSLNFDFIRLILDSNEDVLIANQGKKGEKNLRIGNIHETDIQQKIGNAITKTIENGWQHGSYSADISRE